MKNLVILGSTGSIGTQTLDIVSRNPDKLKVLALAAGKNAALMEEQVREYKPAFAVLYDEKAAMDLKDRIADTDTKVLSGMEGIESIAVLPECDILVGAMVGMIGIRPTLSAIRAGKTIALANKETLVSAGHIIMKAARENNVQILPVDSEHSAIFQSLQGSPKKSVEKILLTASGGPFRKKSKEELLSMTAADALKHPNWDMGPKVTIDSSTLANKGLEVMEAHWLFDVSYDDIEVYVHPESILHSAVQYNDGAVIGQMGVPDMRLPIQYALFYPDRVLLETERLDLFKIADLHFERPDTDRFPALKLAYRAARTGGSLPTVFNAANEEAVRYFLAGKIGYTGIAETVERAMDSCSLVEDPTLDQIFEAEALARESVKRFIGE